MTPFHLLADASGAVAGASKRNEKIALLAELIGSVDHDDLAVVVALMLGEQRQGRVGIGWATLRQLEITPASEATLTVDDVDELLEEVAATKGRGSAAKRVELLRSVLGRATENELSFLSQVLLGEVRQGALAGVITDAVAVAAAVPKPLVRRAAMLRGDLAATAATALSGGATALEAVTLEPLRAVQPMLAATATSVADAIDELGTASVEWKLDGARIQVHRQGHDVRVFTRNLNDITHRLPDVAELVRTFAADPLVLDGEILGLDADGEPLAFQDTASAVGTDAPHRPLRPFFFDVLVADDEVLIDRPLLERRTTLEAVVGDHRVPAITTDEPGEAQIHLDRALAAGHEGVMVKAAHSRYEAGRRGKTWRKVKPVHTLDLLVLAAEWGHGRRRGWLSNLHLGALDPETLEPVMVGKTFKGMTDAVLTWQTEALLGLEVSRSDHVVVVRPELVVEVAVDGVQRSSRYPGGVALRFARLRTYRSDRSSASADTIDTVRALLAGPRRG